MIRRVARDTRTAATAASRSVRTRVMSAASMATSAPDPIANPSPCVPAWARAAASLTPSPTMPTTAPWACRSATTSRLSAGSTSARTSAASIPTCAATCSAARALSPVSSTGRIPSSRRAATAAREEGRTVSRTTRTATACSGSLSASAPISALTASAAWPTARTTAVAPESWVSSTAERTASGTSAPISPVSQPGRPTATRRPSTVAETPRPSWLEKSDGAGRSPRRSRAAAVMAAATGCSEADSTAPARRSISCPSGTRPAAASAPVPAVAPTSRQASTSRLMRPWVTVPVLSMTIVSSARVDSSTSGPLMTTPNWAARPEPTSSAVGVARPSAQGQAMTSTATAAVKAACGLCSVSSHPTKVAADSTRTMGTNTPEIRSARRWTGALPACAAVTIRPIRASVVPSPTAVARTSSAPEVLTVAPVTDCPASTSVGTDSPVSSEASTAERPSTTTPSVATFSPGRTRNRSPAARSSMLMRSSVRVASARGAPSSSRTSTASRLPDGEVRTTRVTSLAPSSSRARRASPERYLARASA